MKKSNICYLLGILFLAIFLILLVNIEITEIKHSEEPVYIMLGIEAISILFICLGYDIEKLEKKVK